MTCGATLVMGDDFGDNSCTMHCGLDAGHTGDHKEIGSLYGDNPYRVTWEKDMRHTCSACKKLAEHVEHCYADVPEHYEEFCADCMTQGEGVLDRRCPAHKDAPGRLDKFKPPEGS